MRHRTRHYSGSNCNIPYHHHKFTLAALMDKRLDVLEAVLLPNSPGALIESCDGDPEGVWLEFLKSEIQYSEYKITSQTPPGKIRVDTQPDVQCIRTVISTRNLAILSKRTKPDQLTAFIAHRVEIVLRIKGVLDGFI